jgi:hypothetical protein
MCKRFTDTGIWDQSWFLELSPESKNIWQFLEKSCDSGGIWKIDIPEIRRKIGYKEINLSTFLEEVNRDYDKLTGEMVKRNRVMLITNKTKLWLTGFISFQYEKGTSGVNVSIPAIKGALNKLKEENIFEYAVENGFVRIKRTCQVININEEGSNNINKEDSSSDLNSDLNINSKGCRPSARDKDKDKDKEQEVLDFKDLNTEEGDKGNIHREVAEGAGLDLGGTNMNLSRGAKAEVVRASGIGGRIPDRVELLFVRIWGKPFKNPEEYRFAGELVERYGFEEVEFAFRESVKYNKMTLAYIAAICRKKKEKAEKEEIKENEKRKLRENILKAEEQKKSGKCLTLLKDLYGEGVENKLMKGMEEK